MTDFLEKSLWGHEILWLSVCFVPVEMPLKRQAVHWSCRLFLADSNKTFLFVNVCDGEGGHTLRRECFAVCGK